MPDPSLVIFDCDGVLVDSEPISIAVLLEMIGKSGVTMSEDEAYDRFLGRSMATISKVLHEEYGFAASEADLDEMRNNLYSRFGSDLKPIPGIAETLKCLHLPRCVASSSQPERIRLSLELTGLIDLLDPHIFSATMVKNGKPAPDLFLFAANTMNVDPTDCVVIEDSPAGIQAAKAAGMRVFAFTGGTHSRGGRLESKLASLGPTLIFNDMLQLPGLLASQEAVLKVR
ncbi:HAD family hydrolase [Phyllobacterium sp. YR531]|uniref:HAD family hydrolase n=1 Tax=Phyllobacterium sp. YR531 TaxID=1144343 RepID=UPI00026F9904|nr:HAD family hydrolase [Phyllobacterium sp. YR531]EJN00538.1 haloacid dehalogenase superfamily protein, subfamily IA, variant 3 with third motif having DD or ED [Phyllobacterium sp. YR531]